ncbi:hypothetical protein HAX54_038402, partial [Datura stramonium]|nr:hypothetical protein [Datura stramonium]
LGVVRCFGAQPDKMDGSMTKKNNKSCSHFVKRSIEIARLRKNKCDGSTTNRFMSNDSWQVLKWKDSKVMQGVNEDDEVRLCRCHSNTWPCLAIT